MSDDAILLNTRVDNPTGGLDLDDEAVLAGLRERIEAEAPALVIVDTVGMTTGCNLGRPEEARKYFGPLMTMASETRTAFLMLTHLARTRRGPGASDRRRQPGGLEAHPARPRGPAGPPQALGE